VAIAEEIASHSISVKSVETLACPRGTASADRDCSESADTQQLMVGTG
jgi:hypothetical protein